MEKFEGINNLITAKDAYYGEVLVDYNDIIMRHQRVEYDHLRLHEYEGDNEEEAELVIALLFLSGVSLDTLAGHGVPEAYLSEPTPITVDGYQKDLLERMERQFDA